MTAKLRTALLTTTEIYNLDVACRLIRRAFGHPPYLVGAAGVGGASSYRDVDVRLILPDDEFAAVCPDRARWELLSMAIGAYLANCTGLPIDFQIQRMTEANEKHKGPRNPLGIGHRGFASGGDGTPEWNAQ